MAMALGGCVLLLLKSIASCGPICIALLLDVAHSNRDGWWQLVVVVVVVAEGGGDNVLQR
jgi:hypothetical protein